VSVVTCGSCEDFSAVLDCSSGGDCDNATKTLTVTFTAGEEGDYVIQGGLTANATIHCAVADKDFMLNTEHNSAGGPSKVTRWEGSLGACETVTIEINYSGGNGVGGWSAKKNDVTHGSSLEQGCN
jgi:hypothetical protein